MLMPSATASADVVWGEPDFWPRNPDDVLRVNRSFIVDSPRGYTVVRGRPNAGRNIRTLENGQRRFISHAYLHRGRLFGIDPDSHGDNSNRGWSPMDELLMPYTGQDFETENADRIRVFDGNIDDVLRGIESLVVWQWPGSDRAQSVMDERFFWLNDDETFEDALLDRVRTSLIYVDDYGRDWVHVSAWGGDWWYDGISGWIPLDDPENITGIYAFNPAPDPIFWWPGEEPDWRGGTHDVSPTGGRRNVQDRPNEEHDDSRQPSISAEVNDDSHYQDVYYDITDDDYDQQKDDEPEDVNIETWAILAGASSILVAAVLIILLLKQTGKS